MLHNISQEYVASLEWLLLAASTLASSPPLFRAVGWSEMGSGFFLKVDLQVKLGGLGCAFPEKFWKLDLADHDLIIIKHAYY